MVSAHSWRVYAPLRRIKDQNRSSCSAEVERVDAAIALLPSSVPQLRCQSARLRTDGVLEIRNCTKNKQYVSKSPLHPLPLPSAVTGTHRRRQDRTSNRRLRLPVKLIFHQSQDQTCLSNSHPSDDDDFSFQELQDNHNTTTRLGGCTNAAAKDTGATQPIPQETRKQEGNVPRRTPVAARRAVGVQCGQGRHGDAIASSAGEKAPKCAKILCVTSVLPLTK